MEQSIEEIQDEIREEFEMFEDWTQKYEYLIDMGKELPPIKEEHRTDDHLVRGCQSKVWLNAEMDGEKLKFTADSDAMITKGIIALLIRVLSGHKPQEVANADLHFIEDIGLREHLSPTRSNGLSSMVKQMKAYALAYQAKENK